MSDFRETRLQILSKFLEDIKAGLRPMGLTTGLNNPIPIEIAAQMGFRWVIADMEHTLMTTTEMINVVRAAEWGRMAAIVKVNSASPTEISDALDSGAVGVQMPKTNTPDEVYAALDAMRYVHQGGSRGLCPVSRSTFYGSGKFAADGSWVAYDDQMAAEALLMPTIETEEALDNIDELLKIDECPIWHIGPADLASSMKIDMDSEEDSLELRKAILWTTRKIQAAGKYVCKGMLPGALASKEFLAQRLADIDVPYTLDSTCMALGMHHVMAGRELFLAPPTDEDA